MIAPPFQVFPRRKNATIGIRFHAKAHLDRFSFGPPPANPAEFLDVDGFFRASSAVAGTGVGGAKNDNLRIGAECRNRAPVPEVGSGAVHAVSG